MIRQNQFETWISLLKNAKIIETDQDYDSLNEDDHQKIFDHFEHERKLCQKGYMYVNISSFTIDDMYHIYSYTESLEKMLKSGYVIIEEKDIADLDYFYLYMVDFDNYLFIVKDNRVEMRFHLDELPQSLNYFLEI